MLLDDDALQKIYLSDALDQVLANPSAAHTWHHLAKYFPHCGAQLQAQIVQVLYQHITETGVAAFFRATFCASLLQEQRYLVEVADILQQLQPCHVDRISAFLGYAWAKMLDKSSDKTTFTADINAIHCAKLVGKMGQMLQEASTTRLPVRPVTAIKKIALIGSHLGVVIHAPTRLLLQHAAVLMGQEIELKGFSCQDFTIPNMQNFFANGEFFNLIEGDPEQWATLLPQPLHLHLGNTQLGLLRRYADMLEPLAEFDPDLIFFIGMYSPLIEVLYRQRPVLALGVHATAPIVSCDAWLSANAQQSLSSPWNGDLQLGPAFQYAHRIAIPPYAALNRLALDLPPDALILVAVGYRLHEKIRGEWAVRMSAFLAAQPQALLLLVGGDTVPSDLQHVESEQLLLLPRQENVSGILDCCDIYVNPVRMGGGFSVLEAMASCLPVVALRDADGGNKLGDYAAPDLDSYFAQLTQLAESAELRFQVGNALRAKFYEEFDLGHAGPRLLQACEQARQHFVARRL